MFNGVEVLNDELWGNTAQNRQPPAINNTDLLGSQLVFIPPLLDPKKNVFTGCDAERNMLDLSVLDP